MKMEYNFTSPKDGTIKKVLVKAGSVVSAGTVFVEWA
jgi:biotin carboxyl carrier protein